MAREKWTKEDDAELMEVRKEYARAQQTVERCLKREGALLDKYMRIINRLPDRD